MLTKVIELGRLCLQLGRVNRATFHEDGMRPETDTDHTVMLSVVACAVAAQVAPHLDLGMVAQFSIVHDLIEARAGDTVTLGEYDSEEKAQREAAGFAAMVAEFGVCFPWLPRQIALYESQAHPEARFVKVLDKVMPCITHLLNGGETLRQRGITAAELRVMREQQREKIAGSYGADQPEAMRLLAAVHALLDEMIL